MSIPPAAAARPLLFSVVIPSYNYARFLRQAIDSVLRQTLSDYELIVFDDGSTDESWEIIQSYGDRLRAYSSRNQGAARACLAAARLATGRYILFLDADDELEPNCLETVAGHLAGNPAKIQFQLIAIDARGEQIGPPFPTFPSNYGRREMVTEIARNGYHQSPPCSGIVYRADVIAAIKDIDYERYIDGVAYLLAPFMGEVATIAQPLGRYRYHGSNASSFDGPTPEWLDVERTRHAGRLAHLKALCAELGLKTTRIPAGEQTAFHFEKLILHRIVTRKALSPGLTLAYVRRLWWTTASSRLKLLMFGWAVANHLLPRDVRCTVMRWRGNPYKRPRLLKWLKARI